MLRNLLTTCMAVFVLSSVSLAQVGQGSLQGKITDASTGEPLPFVNVIVELNGNQAAGGASDFDGKFTIKPITPGTYNVKASFTGYKPLQINGVVVTAKGITYQDVSLEATVIDIKEFEVIQYTVPLISKDNTSSGQTVTREEIKRMPGRSAVSVVATVGGVYSRDDGSGNINIRGARSDANYYFIDGMKVRGTPSVPNTAIEQMSVLTGGLPANYGDVTGGVISITTRGPSSKYFGSLDYSTSGYKIGDKTYGLDHYGYNLLEYSLSGPVLFRKDSTGAKLKPLFGFFISGNLSSVVDGSPSAIGNWKIKDEELDALTADPLRSSFSGDAGVIQNADFLRLNQLEKVRFRQNVASRGLSLAGKLDFNTSANTNLTIGGTMNYSRNRNANYNGSLLNWANNSQSINTRWQSYVRFTQRFSQSENEEGEASTVKNIYYSIQAEASQAYNKNWDETHKDDLFKYGYIGEFRSFRDRSFGVGVDSTTQILGIIQTTFEDTLIGFTPSDINPEAAQFTQRYYELSGWQGYDADGNPVFDQALAQDRLTNLDLVRENGGYLNGDAIDNVYNMWVGPATQSNSFSTSVATQYRLTASGSADIKDHAISVGFEYEQRVDRAYTVAPRALWTQGRLLANNHSNGLDFSNPTIVYNASQPTITYENLNSSPGEYRGEAGGDNQAFFDYNLRNALGLDPDGVDFLDVFSYDPELLKIDFFSANELYRDGNNSLVSYYGYDPYGNKVTNDPSLDAFFGEDPDGFDEFGNFTRPIGAFRPIYVAGYIQDKFSFDDLVFNIGVRVDRFDANQPVLIDPFVLFPSIRAREVESLRELGLLGDDDALPGTVGDDFVVYVDNVENPTSIVGYRDETTWYNAEGAELDNGSTLRASNGVPAPLLLDRDNTNSRDVTSSSFEDYKPQTNVMPRVAFSFPISDEALFFAHYDVLTKRPTTGLRFDPSNYYFLESRAGQTTFSNPALRPEKTIDYEIGFQQKLTQSSSLKIATFYREIRDNVQVIRVADAYPRSYTSFGNIDFGTVKGMTLTYDLRRTGNLRMRAEYTLQFAEGTGSSATSGLNLAATNNDNLRTTIPLSYDQRHTIVTTMDYRFAAGKNYNGPVWFGKQIFANTGASVTFNAGSGTPYSAQSNITANGLFTPGAAILDGQISGSRLPWQFRSDARIDKDIELTFGKEDKQHQANLTIYLQLLNLFNTKNVVNIYRATGNAEDDGYLNAAEFQNDIALTNDEQAFRELYNIKVNRPGNFSLPRRIRMGVIMNF